MSETDKLKTEWPQASRFKKSVTREFSIYISVIIISLMSITGFVITSQYVKSTTENVIEKLVVQARAFSGSAGKHILSPDGPDVLMLNNTCKKLMEDNEDIYWAGVSGSDNQFLAHSDINQVISQKKLSQPANIDKMDILKPGEQFDIVNDTLYLSVPIEENGVALGKIAVASTTAQIKSARQMTIITVSSISIVMLLIGLPFAMFMMHRKLRPVKTITDYLKQMNFDNIKFDMNIKDKNEFGYLSETLQVMGDRLQIAQNERIEKERISREYEIAHEIQANILPQSFPSETEFKFSGMYKSAKEVGGDYYDFIEFDRNRIGFLIADVSGKSLPGMLVMLLTRDIVNQMKYHYHEPGALLSAVNERLLPHIKRGMFVTMFIGILDKRTGRFSFASAGHNPLIRVNKAGQKSDLIKTKGFPLGMISPDKFNQRIETAEIALSPEDWLISFTDGVNEAQNGENEEYGMVRFIEAVEKEIDSTPEQLVQNVLQSLNCFVDGAPQYDDITLLAMKWNGISADSSNKENKGSVREYAVN